jgi:predicted transcriptional regulator
MEVPRDIEDAEQKILDAVEQESPPPTPSKLIENLKGQGVSETTARQAIWRLIDKKRVDLRWDRSLGPSRS